VLGFPPNAPAAGRAALKLESISLSFGGVSAVSEVSIEVQEGQIRAIIGPNGAGKSSLINILTGIYRPDSGRVWIGSDAFTRVPTGRLARLGVARTFQNLALFQGLTVFENIRIAWVAFRRASFWEELVGLGRSRGEQRESAERTDAILRFLGLDAVRNRLVSTLPYGVQKRVELGRALVTRPKILLLDEPLAGMNAAEKREIADLIRAARDAFQTTVVLIEHDLGVVMGLSDRVAVLDYGRKIADGTPLEVRRDQAVIDAYVGAAHEDDGEEAAA
jgi:branched-chain amino acid transport system ATP-binding protein